MQRRGDASSHPSTKKLPLGFTRIYPDKAGFHSDQPGFWSESSRIAMADVPAPRARPAHPKEKITRLSTINLDYKLLALLIHGRDCRENHRVPGRRTTFQPCRTKFQTDTTTFQPITTIGSGALRANRGRGGP